jgi:hypothetical protein
MQVYFGCCLIKGREIKKKETGDSSVNVYLRLWLICPLLSACCWWRLFYADLRSELDTQLAPQAVFTLSSPGHDCHCYKLSLF